MPLSKRKQALYQKERRARIKVEKQPKTTVIDGKTYVVPELDADGNVIYEEE